MIPEELLYDDDFAEKVKRVFWREGLIVAMPAQLKKRKVLLDLLPAFFRQCIDPDEFFKYFPVPLLKRGCI